MRRARTIGCLPLLVPLLGALAAVGCGADDDEVLVSSAPLVFSDGVQGFDGFRIRYLIDGVSGQATEVTGIVGIPEGDPPEAGWPVLGFAHGTTGAADSCAPSAAANLDFQAEALGPLVRAGFVVAATDYEGLGTAEEHPYLHGTSEARSLAGAVEAAVEVAEAPTSDQWVAVGYSQGGHAAVFAAELGADAVDGIELAGAVAIAPAAGLPALPGLPPEEARPGLLALVLSGYLAAEVDVEPRSLLTDAGVAAVEDARTLCNAGLAQGIADLQGRPLLLDGVSGPATPFGEYLIANDPGQVQTGVPLLVVQGEGDVVVEPELTADTVARLCQLGDDVELRTYPGADHTSILATAAPDVLAWITDRFGGASTASTCTS